MNMCTSIGDVNLMKMFLSSCIKLTQEHKVTLIRTLLSKSELRNMFFFLCLCNADAASEETKTL